MIMNIYLLFQVLIFAIALSLLFKKDDDISEYEEQIGKMNSSNEGGTETEGNSFYSLYIVILLFTIMSKIL